MDRPKKLKFTKEQKTEAKTRLKSFLYPDQKLCFESTSIGSNRATSEWIILAYNPKTNRIETITRDIAGILDRQFGSNLSLRGWEFDSPGSIIQDLSKSLDLPLGLQ